jgi:hypothetical protein
MSATTIQKWRQCIVSMATLETRIPQSAASRAAEPMPYVSRPAAAFEIAAMSVAARNTAKTTSPAIPCSARARTYALCAEIDAYDSNCPGPSPSGYGSDDSSPSA